MVLIVNGSVLPGSAPPRRRPSFDSKRPRNSPCCGIKTGIIACVAMTLRLSDEESEALRQRAALEGRSMQEVARQAIREYVEQHSRADLLERVLDEEVPRYAEALRRLAE